MTADIDFSTWNDKAEIYRGDDTISSAIAMAQKFKVDTSLLKELSRYFPYLRSQDNGSRAIRGPADLDRGLAVASELQAIKDRAAEVSIRYEDLRSRLERLHDIVKSHVITKKDVMGLKNDAQRTAVVALTSPEIEDKLTKVRRICAASDRVTKNVNQSYNILKLQIDIVKEMMYEAGLSNAVRNKRQLSKEMD